MHLVQDTLHLTVEDVVQDGHILEQAARCQLFTAPLVHGEKPAVARGPSPRHQLLIYHHLLVVVVPGDTQAALLPRPGLHFRTVAAAVVVVGQFITELERCVHYLRMVLLLARFPAS